MRGLWRALIPPLTVLAVILLAAPAGAYPVEVPYSGQLADDGELVNGNVTMNFQIIDPNGGDSIEYASGPRTVSVTNGSFSFTIGASPQPVLDSSVFATNGLELRIIAAGERERSVGGGGGGGGDE